MISLALSTLLLTAAAADGAPALDRSDEGMYMLVHRNGQLVETHINKLQLDGDQWNFYKRLESGGWESVTCEDACKLKISTADEVAQFTKDTTLVGSQMACVHDSSFAFCRSNTPDGGRSYHMLAFVTGQVIPVSFVRIDPQSMKPASAP